MSNELMRMSGINGSDIVDAEVFTPPSGFLIYAAVPRADGGIITGFKEMQGIGTQDRLEVAKTLNAEDTNLDIALVTGELITFRFPLSELTFNTAAGLRVYYITD